MGTYPNEGSTLYARAVNSEIHVDKSLLIRETNRRIRTQDKYVCLSRPRRFGKSMAAHMLMAYYTRGADSRELFKDKKISADPSFERHFGRYNVIHLRMTDFVADGIDAMAEDLLATLKLDISQVESGGRGTGCGPRSSPRPATPCHGLPSYLQKHHRREGHQPSRGEKGSRRRYPRRRHLVHLG